MKKLIPFAMLSLLIGISLVAAFSSDTQIGMEEATDNVREFIGKPDAVVDFRANETVTHGELRLFIIFW